MNDRNLLIEYSIELEIFVSEITLYSFGIDMQNIKVTNYFKSMACGRQLELLRDFGVISSHLKNRINVILKIRNLLVHTKEIDSLVKVNDQEILKNLLSISKTIPSDFEKMIISGRNELLNHNLKYIFENSLSELNLILAASKKKFDETIYTKQKREVSNIYKAFSKAMNKLFKELKQFRISERRVEQIKDRYYDIFLNELAVIDPENYGIKENPEGNQKEH